MYLPAWRINQIGVYGTGSRRQARMKGLFASRVALLNWAGSTKATPILFKLLLLNFHR
jgi:hypothetical protein